MDASERETTGRLAPKWDANGLIAAVATDADSGEVLMLAWMNEAALQQSQETGFAHFWSRSRQKQWMKGETSGNRLAIVEMRIDCDQDAVWILARPEGPACHTGERSCFYRRIGPDGLERV